MPVKVEASDELDSHFLVTKAASSAVLIRGAKAACLSSTMSFHAGLYLKSPTLTTISHGKRRDLADPDAFEPPRTVIYRGGCSFKPFLACGQLVLRQGRYKRRSTAELETLYVTLIFLQKAKCNLTPRWWCVMTWSLAM